VPTIAASHEPDPEVDRTPWTDRFEGMMLITEGMSGDECGMSADVERTFRSPPGASLATYALEIEVEAAVLALAEEASFSSAAMNSVN
jgi:hypothetical protein